MFVLALDIGSSSTRAAVFDERGRQTSRVFAQAYAIRYGEDSAAELNPRTLRASARAALTSFKSRAVDVVASCAFWHGLLGLDANCRPLTPIYTWADSRCAPDAARLRARLSENEILQRTGCMLRFPFWPAKLRWLRRTEGALFRRVRFWVSPSDWILHDLFNELGTSESMANGTGLFDQRRRGWDLALCDAAGVRPSQLPPICDAINDGKVLTAIGDGAAGNIGSGATSEDIAAINLGTSGAVRVMTHRRLHIPNGLFRFVAGEQTFVFGGAISNAGNLRVWCQEKLHLPHSARLERQLAAADTLTALPFVIAERAPDWPKYSGRISGYNFATKPLEVFRALMTSALYRVADIFDLLEQSLGRIHRIIVSGGMTRSHDTLGILADALGRDLELAIETEASLRGAALHALASGGDSAPTQRQGGIVRCNKSFTELHRGRREKQRLLASALESRRSLFVRT